MKTQQEIVELYRQLLPQIRERKQNIEILIKGETFKIPIVPTQTVIKGRVNRSYRNI